MSVSSSKVLKSQTITLIISAILLIIKFVAFEITGSYTILSDALESIVNVAAGSFALYSVYLSNQPSDANHPYGHGKIEFLSSGLEGLLIIIAGIGIVFKGIEGFIKPHVIQELDTGILLITFSGIVNWAMGEYLIHFGKKSHSLAMESNGRHLRTDALSTLGILVSLLIIWFTHLDWLDNAFAIIFGIIISFTGIKIIRKSVAGIMDEADVKIINQLVDLLEVSRKDNWIDIHNFRVIKYGRLLHVDCHVTIPWYVTVKEGHAIIDEIERIVNREFVRHVEFFIHIDPCTHSSCAICTVKNCSERKDSFVKKIKWSEHLLTLNRRHKLHEST